MQWIDLICQTAPYLDNLKLLSFLFYVSACTEPLVVIKFDADILRKANTHLVIGPLVIIISTVKWGTPLSMDLFSVFPDVPDFFVVEYFNLFILCQSAFKLLYSTYMWILVWKLSDPSVSGSTWQLFSLLPF